MSNHIYNVLVVFVGWKDILYIYQVFIVFFNNFNPLSRGNLINLKWYDSEKYKNLYL